MPQVKSGWPKSIRDSIDEYNKLLALPVDKFPGDRTLALLNLSSYIGERVIQLYNAEITHA